MIRISGVSFSYGVAGLDGGVGKPALADVDLSVARGEFVLLCGESGCGKTTLTRLINGLVPHFYDGVLSGSVSVGGMDVSLSPLHDISKVVGSVFQNPRSQFFNVDTTSELAFGCENRGLPESEIRERVARSVRDLSLSQLVDRSIFELSGGEKQKIACGAVSACDPPIIVLDEPSSNLDSGAVSDLRRCLKLWKSRGKTIVVSEHRLHYLADLADTVVYMRDGKIAKNYSAEEFRRLSPVDASSLGLRPIDLASYVRERASFVGRESAFSDVLRVVSLSLSRSGAKALAVSDMDIPAGRVTALIGANGAGKSTFARSLCGLERRAKGSIRYRGKNRSCAAFLADSYLVMQDVNHQLFAESVFDEVSLGMDRGIEEERRKETVERILGNLDLLQFRDAHPMSLSGGQKQRVAVAGAIAANADVIVFDEPTSGLDFRMMGAVASQISALARRGKTVLVITHDLELTLACCSFAVRFAGGKVVDAFSVDESNRARLLDSFGVRE
jgi:energy-coupling factor transport system ATP-binding protein